MDTGAGQGGGVGGRVENGAGGEEVFGNKVLYFVRRMQHTIGGWFSACLA